MAYITFMIGNGFDLACGLKTKFTDTYNEYINSPSPNISISHFKQDLESDIETWSDFEMRMAKYAKSFSTESEFIQCVRDYTKFLNKHLKKQEEILARLLAQPELRSPIINETAKLMSRFHYGLIKNDYNQIERMLDSQLNRINVISFNYTSTLEKLVDLLQNEADGNPLFEHSSTIDSVIHIHGELDNDVTLGVDNEQQLESLPYTLTTRGKRVFIKPFFNSQYDRQRVEETKRIIFGSNIICTFGWSLGDSDQTWRSEILEWVLRDSYHHLIVLSHKLLSKEYSVCSITEQMDDAEDYKEALLNKLASGVTSDDYEKLFSRIHIPVGYNVFDLPASIPKYKEYANDLLKPATKKDITDLIYGTT